MRHTLAIAALALSAAAAGCASKPAAAPATSGGMSWKLQGTRLIGCCCATPCS